MLKKTVLVLAVMLLARTAHAVPELQLYIEGASWDAGSETWIGPATGTIRLWTIANVGAKGAIDDVKLSVAYASGLTPTMTLVGSSTGGYNGFADPSVAGNPVYNQTVTNGSSPILGDGSSLPAHGIYGAGTDWQEFKLGNFNLTDSYITDFNGSTTTPTPDLSATGQINVYEFSVAGVAEGTSFHFDLYDHYYNHQDAKYKFAPFSHDAGTGDNEPVPEPGTLALVGMGAVGLVSRLRKRVAA